MKKIYVTLFILFAAKFSNAQITLTSAFNKPVSGDSYNTKGFDSTTVINRSTGANKLWNFTSLASNLSTSNLSYTVSSSALNPAAFPGASLASFDAFNLSNGYNYYKTNGSNFEFMGVTDNTPSTVSFSNTAIEAIYPISFGSNYSDTYGGLGTFSSTTASYLGTVNVNASGTGTIILPGNVTLTNCLQVVTSRTIMINIPATITATVIDKYYDYYHSSQKFPIISIQYSSGSSSFGPIDNFSAEVNSNSILGMVENSASARINIYPNPVTDKLNILLDNNSFNQSLNFTIKDLSGKIVKENNFIYESNTEINVSDLKAGFYILNISSGGVRYNKKFVKE
jgi:hypothetical protein